MSQNMRGLSSLSKGSTKVRLTCKCIVIPHRHGRDTSRAGSATNRERKRRLASVPRHLPGMNFLGLTRYLNRFSCVHWMPDSLFACALLLSRSGNARCVRQRRRQQSRGTSGRHELRGCCAKTGVRPDENVPWSRRSSAPSRTCGQSDRASSGPAYGHRPVTCGGAWLLRA
jgi:hypothetical protein